MRHGNFDNDDLDAVSIAVRYKTEFKHFFFALVGVQHDAHDYIHDLILFVPNFVVAQSIFGAKKC
jgi:UDP-N-acetylmuramyl pentapeptide synthase